MVYFIAFDSPLQKLQCVSLRKTPVSDLGQIWYFWPCDIRDRGILSCNDIPRVQWNQRFLNPNLRLHSMASWNSLPRVIWDRTYNWFCVLKPKRISGLRISKFEKMYLGMGEVIKLPIGSRGPFYCFWLPIAKIAMFLTKQTPSFRSRLKNDVFAHGT